MWHNKNFPLIIIQAFFRESKNLSKRQILPIRPIELKLTKIAFQILYRFLANKKIAKFRKISLFEFINKMADLIHAIAGSLASVITSFMVQPLDVIKTGILTQTKQISIQEAIKFVNTTYGPKGFWRGVRPAVYRASISGGINFTLLEMFNKILKPHQSIKGRFLHDSESAVLARLVVIITLSPLSIIKLRMEAPQFNQYTSVSDAFAKIYKEEGTRGFYKGFSSSLLRDLPYSALAYAFYEQYSAMIFYLTGMGKKYSFNTFTSGVLAGFTACLLTQPFDIMKTRLQFAYVGGHKVNGLYNGLIEIWKEEGLRGFTRGLGVRVIERSCSFGIIWLIYEKLKLGLKKQRHKSIK
ncbi:unnamed protein product [Blepharisma stoltei]|uniref:Mitochondrial carrier protein n=1 Tax=Blepharisma stoltei TaxID=1481888 RepID=A0AAU9K7L2_9CILI|nr:unnamed protein product [Blepharisma stoltei]